MNEGPKTAIFVGAALVLSLASYWSVPNTKRIDPGGTVGSDLFTFDDPADADRQRKTLQERALRQGVETRTHRLGKHWRHLIVFGNNDGQCLPEDRRGQKFMVVSPGLQRHARLLGDGRR